MAINLANNNSLANITALPSGISGGAMTLLATQTASGSANLSFTSGIDDTYDSYVFKFIDIHPVTNAANFRFQASTNTGTSYGITATDTFFAAIHSEDNSQASLAYYGSLDIAQGTGFIDLGGDTGNGNDECLAGQLTIYSPSSTTFVKHFISRASVYNNTPMMVDAFVGGYFNTTTAIDAIQFKFDSGNIDSGVIKLYGVS